MFLTAVASEVQRFRVRCRTPHGLKSTGSPCSVKSAPLLSIADQGGLICLSRSKELQELRPYQTSLCAVSPGAAASASCHSRSGRSPSKLESLTARARRRAFSSSSHRTSCGADSSCSSRGDEILRSSSGATLAAPRRRSRLLCGGFPLGMASPQVQDVPPVV